MHTTINSRIYGPQTFWMPDTGGYIRLERGANHGTLGTQICEGGGFRGATLCATPDTFEQVVRRWWKQRMRDNATAL
jgi:hypothetical protein